MRRWLFASLICSLNLLMAVPALAAPPPATADVTVTAKVCPNPPAPPVITAPTSGATTTSVTITVSGTSAPFSNITLTRNAVFAGATVASGSGTWSLAVTLVPGLNTLVADNCLPSGPVNVNYVPPGPPTPPAPGPGPQPNQGPSGAPGTPSSGTGPSGTPASPGAGFGAFYATSGRPVQSIGLGDTAEVPLELVGGQGPFQIVWEWGDGRRSQEETVLRQLSSRHRYEKSGNFTATATIRDASGAEAVLSVVVRVRPELSLADIRQYSPYTFPYVVLLELLLIMLVWVVWEYAHRKNSSG